MTGISRSVINLSAWCLYHTQSACMPVLQALGMPSFFPIFSPFSASVKGHSDGPAPVVPLREEAEEDPAR